MKKQILWKGIADQSLEYCSITNDKSGIQVHSSIVGSSENIIFKVVYQIELDPNWQVKYYELKAEMSDSDNIWSASDKNCGDIDIPLTPFTNSLPINRLKLSIGQKQIIDVIYIDVLQREIRHLKQFYKRLNKNTYRYENIPNDFEAEIKVDEDGLVIEYPQLFTRIQ